MKHLLLISKNKILNTLLSKYLALILYCSAIITTYAQEVKLDYFNGFASGNEIELRWVLPAGFLCEGMRIYRSTDTLTQLQIGYIGGICGDSEAPVEFRWKDTNPLKNTINIYRLELGNYGFSRWISIEYFDYKDSDYILFHHPDEDYIRIRFHNPNNNQLNLLIYNSNASVVESKVLYSAESIIPTSKLSKGVYLFYIYNEKRVIRGKFAIIK